MSKEHLAWIREYFTAVYKTPVLENFLNLKILELETGKVKYGTRISDDRCNIYGATHGGTLASICDVVMGVACTTMGKRIVTIDMSVNYIKNAPAGSELTAVGRIISNGRTIMRAEGEVYHGEQLLVKAQASYFVTGNFRKDDYPKPGRQ